MDVTFAGVGRVYLHELWWSDTVHNEFWKVRGVRVVSRASSELRRSVLVDEQKALTIEWIGMWI